ncbi:hypothetical protein BDF19DRAFT_3052 [Syncephalis fuscata]|nr:hypothetical protein BDF19DRAFT_3052 [Syncephalis fuscata]
MVGCFLWSHAYDYFRILVLILDYSFLFLSVSLSVFLHNSPSPRPHCMPCVPFWTQGQFRVAWGAFAIPILTSVVHLSIFIHAIAQSVGRALPLAPSSSSSSSSSSLAASRPSQQLVLSYFGLVFFRPSALTTSLSLLSVLCLMPIESIQACNPTHIHTLLLSHSYICLDCF